MTAFVALWTQAAYAERVADSELEKAISTTLDAVATSLVPSGAAGEELATSLRTAVIGGKRVRARLLDATYRAYGGTEAQASALMGAAIELFQVAALIHDDVIDASQTRRGRPAAHLAFAESHRARLARGDASRYGEASAILAGDLALVAAQRAAAEAAAVDGTVTTRALRAFAEMTALVTAGQFLDLQISSAPIEDLPAQEGVIRSTMRSKTASYTAEFPLALGAILAGAEHEEVALARQCGLPAGLAFQLTDDVLGIVGDSATTGKPVGDDIREGKRTLPLWRAWVSGGPAVRESITHALRDPNAQSVAEAIDSIRTTDSLKWCETEVAELLNASATTLSELTIDPPSRAQLGDMLGAWSRRSS